MVVSVIAPVPVSAQDQGSAGVLLAVMLPAKTQRWISHTLAVGKSTAGSYHKIFWVFTAFQSPWHPVV